MKRITDYDSDYETGDTEIDLRRQCITEITGLETLTELQGLYLYYNRITKINGLETLTELRILKLSKNKIAKIQGLETLTELQELYLDDNQITEIPMTIMMCGRLKTVRYDYEVKVNQMIRQFLNQNIRKSNNL